MLIQPTDLFKTLQVKINGFLARVHDTGLMGCRCDGEDDERRLVPIQQRLECATRGRERGLTIVLQHGHLADRGE
jgi:hypothetical protein